MGTLGNQWETILDRAKARGLSIGYYVSDLPFPALYGTRGLAWVRPVAQFYADAAVGRLPNVLRRPSVQGRGWRRRDLGGRAPAR